MNFSVAIDNPDSTPLGRAVLAFNSEASKTDVGSKQPPLTEDEVVAAIRAWDQKKQPPDEVLEAYRRIAEERVFPPNADFCIREEYRTAQHRICVWCIDLRLELAENRGYSFRVRSHKLSSRKLTPDDFPPSGGPSWRDPD